ncbi:MAG: L,D-transpeptidase family protein [Candidatus Firestonebacteria bacterium]|nr:L,D-transpeptidase family protein [Candidatus Firestonebacteria bacterium]
MRWMGRAGICLVFGWLSGSAFAEGDPLQSVRAEMALWLQTMPAAGMQCREGEALTSLPLLAKFYQTRRFAPVWFTPQGLAAQAEPFVQILTQAVSEGLRPEDYHTEKLSDLLPALRESRPPYNQQAAVLAASAELLLSDAFFLYGTHLAVGRMSLEARDGAFYDPRKAYHLNEHLAEALDQDGVFRFFQAWNRQDTLTQGLKNALRNYRALNDRGDWIDIPEGPDIHLGEQDALRLPEVRRKLRALGDLSLAGERGLEPWLDEEMQAALKQYQRRNSLKTTGVLDSATVATLNRPLENIVRQLEINLERRRWLPRDLGRRYVLVNIPDFLLRLREDDRTTLRLRVVVGKQYRMTPVFAAEISSVVLNPSWVIPTQIILKEKLTEIRTNPDSFFSKNHILAMKGREPNIEIIDPAGVDWRHVKKSDYYEFYRFRQEPGPWNALGRIKFVSPNLYDVYLHDTPQRELFNESVRDFSHGCIRVEKPLALAEALLADPLRWTHERLVQALAKKPEQTIDLYTPVPVYINYMTTFVGDDGLLYFFPDIYHRDQELASVWDRPLLNPCQPTATPLL